MDNRKRLFICILAIISVFVVYAESNYNIAELYSVIKPSSGTKAVGKYDKTLYVEYILTPTKVDTGKYIVEVKGIGDNLYQIKDTNICI